MSQALPDNSIYRSRDTNLSDYQIRHLQPTDDFNRRCNAAVDLLASFLKSGSGLNVAETVKSGSLGKGTAVRAFCDLDLVVFVNGYRAVGDFKSSLPGITDRLQDSIRRWDCSATGFTKGIIAKKSRLLCITINSVHDGSAVRLRVDTVPAFMTTAPRDLYQQMASLQTAEDRSYYSSSLCKLQREFISSYPSSVKDVIRHVKFWRKTHFKHVAESVALPKSYAIELVTIHVWERAGSASSFQMDRMLKSVFTKLAEASSISASWTKYYTASERDEYSRNARVPGRPFILDPANPFNNVAADCDWTVISQMARATANSLLLQSCTPYGC